MVCPGQQGPLSGASVGRFTPEPLPKRLLFVEPLRRRLRVKLADEWIADSEDVLLLHEPGRYPVAFFAVADVRHGVLVSENRTTQHRDFGDTEWFTVTVGDRRTVRGAWQFTAVPDYAGRFACLSSAGTLESHMKMRATLELNNAGAARNRSLGRASRQASVQIR